MSGEFEAAGTAIEGALVGAAVEPTHGESGGDRGSGICKNCGATLSGPYCASCGQQAHVHRTFSAIWHDILHSVLHFDGKLWRTLPMLAFKPGELTRRYIHGERAKFVSPMAFFLFSIFLMFAVFSFTGGPFGSGTSTHNVSFKKDIEAEVKKLDAEISETEAKISAPNVSKAEQISLLSKLGNLKADRNGIAFVQTGKVVYTDADISSRSSNGAKVSVLNDISTGFPTLDAKIRKGGEKMVSNPNLAVYKLQSNGYKFAWLLIPLSLPFIWLVTLGVRGHHFYDHAVFTTYSITFMCFWFISVSLLNRTSFDLPLMGIVLLMIPPVHLYIQLRHAYALSRFGAMLRMVPLMLSIVIVMTLFMSILLFLGIA